MGVLSKFSSGGANILDQIASIYIISHSIKKTVPCIETPKLLSSRHIPDKYNPILVEHGMELAERAAQVSYKNTLYKSLYSKQTLSVDHFLELKDGKFGVAIFYKYHNSNIFVFIRIYNEVKRNFHLIEVCPTEICTIYSVEDVKQKLMYLTFATKEVVTIEPNRYEKT